MENREPKNYQFKQIETGLTAFMATFEKRLNEIYPDIPVFVLDSGDESYIFKEKFEKLNEAYLQVPRAIISINEIEFNTDQDTNQYIKIIYKFLSSIFRAQFRRKATNVPIICSFVCSNFIKALEYLEVLGCILSIDNTFTYDYMGNNYQASFNVNSFGLEKNSMDVGGTKNYIVKANIDLQLQLFLIKFRTIEDLGNGGGLNSGNINGTGDGLNPYFQIISKNGVEDYNDKLDPNNPEIPDEPDNN
jgi:hypothetical protein